MDRTKKKHIKSSSMLMMMMMMIEFECENQIKVSERKMKWKEEEVEKNLEILTLISSYYFIPQVFISIFRPSFSFYSLMKPSMFK